MINALWGEFEPADDLPSYKARVLNPYNLKELENQPLDEFERGALADIIPGGHHVPAPTMPRLRDKTEPGAKSPSWRQRHIAGKREFEYIQAVVFKPGCLMICHGREDAPIDNHLSRPTPDGRDWVTPKVGDLAGVVIVTLPMDQTIKAINNNRAMLITAALITAILAMFSSYTIVRYVIVKPVKHLRDVSDAIAAGRLNIRSQIETGDEFEELSHAFNRMLHNLVAMQQELREVNNDLDRKVDELAQANLALFEMNRLKSDFLATMSHELRTPLNSIIGFSEVLAATEQLQERHRRYASNIQSSGRMLLSMINDILDLAKIESGKMEVRSEDFSIRDVCEGLTNLCRPRRRAQEHHAGMPARRGDSALAPGPGQAAADPVQPALQRHQVHARGRARHLARAAGGPVRRDRGRRHRHRDRRGRPRNDLREVPPGQGSPARARRLDPRARRAPGLGLSIVRELTKLLGGDVHLDSQPGQGSTFTVRIPMLLPGNRKFEVTLSDERIDLTKARRIEAQPLPCLTSRWYGPRAPHQTTPTTIPPGPASASRW